MQKLNYSDLKSYLVVKKGLSASTIEGFMTCIKVVDRFLTENGLDYAPLSIEKFLFELKTKGLKDSAINNYVLHLKRLYAYFKSRNILTEDFASDLVYKKEERQLIDVLSVDEIKRIVDDPDKPYYSILSEFLALTGCRVSEATLLKVKNFNPNGWVIFTQTKTKTVRKVGIVGSLLTKLIELTKDKNDEDFVFSSKFAKSIQLFSYQKYLRLRGQELGIRKRLFPHLFRHSFITQLISEGVPITVVGAIVGHSDINSTAWYTHLADETLKIALYKHPIIRGDIPPNTIIENILETIKGFKLQDDPRFSFRLVEGSNSLEFMLFAK